MLLVQEDAAAVFGLLPSFVVYASVAGNETEGWSEIEVASIGSDAARLSTADNESSGSGGRKWSSMTQWWLFLLLYWCDNGGPRERRVGAVCD